MHSDMSLRIHSYSRNPDYHAQLYYVRDSAWNDLTDRLLVGRNGGPVPITVNKGYRQVSTCSLMLNNEDSLLTPENTTSAFNLNAADEYDPLINPSRKVQLKQGINCYASLSESGSITASVVASGGTLADLLDGLYGDVTNESDTEWVYWTDVAGDASVALTIDLGSSLIVRHGMVSFLSKGTIDLPASVQFSASADDSTYTNIGSAFDMSRYNDSTAGQRFLAWFTDIDASYRYVKATITNISTTNSIYIDEFAVWGGTSTTFKSVDAITGYLGDSIDVDPDGCINLQFRDVRKKESDNRRTELTLEYKDQRPEQIIYDLLTNLQYWNEGSTDNTNLVSNGNFESGATGWTLSDAGDRISVTSGSGYPGGHSAVGRLVASAARNAQQTGIAVTAEKTYFLSWWHRSEWNAYGTYVEIVTDTAETTRYPASGEISFTDSWSRAVTEWTTPAGASSVTLKVYFTLATGLVGGVDDIQLQEVLSYSGYSNAITPDEIGWSPDDNLTDFVVTKWQGQQGTILEYIEELANLVGWVYDADGSGIRQFWQPSENLTIASQYMDFFGNRIIGPENCKRTYTDDDIRNLIKLVGYENGNNEVPREYRHEASIASYGVRYARITEPLIKNTTMSDYLGKALLRDFAWAGRGCDVAVIGDFDIDRMKGVCTFKEPTRLLLDKSELWAIQNYATEMRIAGKGFYRGVLSTKRYFSSMPAVVETIAGTGGNTTIDVSWDANTEIDLDGYYVYWSTAADGTFTKRDKVVTNADTITGLTNGTAYWFYATAVNIAGVEGEPSAIVRCLAGIGNSGTEATTWGISGLTATLTDNTSSIALDLSWTPSLVFDPDFIVVNLYGPSTASPPTIARNHGPVNVADSVEAHYYNNYNTVDYTSGTTYYWRLGISEVVIKGIHYKFGSHLLSDVASGEWP